MNLEDLKLPPGMLDEDEDEPRRAVVLRNPADTIHLKTVEEYIEAANAYFAHCYDNEIHPRLNSFALHIGLNGPSGVHRLAMRRPELRDIISRCITAIAAWYEESLTTSASKGAVFALKHLKDFDREEPEGALPLPFWQDSKEVILENRIVGVRRLDDKGKEYTPQEAYLRIVQGQSVVEINQIVNGEEQKPERLHHRLSVEYAEDADFQEGNTQHIIL